MTETLTPIEVLKSKQNFADYIENNSDRIISELLCGYPQKNLHIVIPQLTQSDEGFMAGLSDLRDDQQAYIFWFIVNEKERQMGVAKHINKAFSRDYGMFVVKFFANEDKIGCECLLKPELQAKRTRNENTPAKQLQNEYWEEYSVICDELGFSNYQVNPEPRHYQYISIRKSGVQIVQTINTQKNYIATELLINNKQEIFESLLEHKDEIEKELGELDWQALEGKKSSRIRKSKEYDLSDKTIFKSASEEHIKMAESFDKTFKKYL